MLVAKQRNKRIRKQTPRRKDHENEDSKSQHHNPYETFEPDPDQERGYHDPSISMNPFITHLDPTGLWYPRLAAIRHYGDLLSQLDFLTNRNDYLEHIMAEERPHPELTSSTHENQAPESQPVEFKHLAGSRVTFGTFSVTLPTRDPLNHASPTQAAYTGSQFSNEETQYTPVSSVTAPLRSHSEPPSPCAPEHAPVHDPRTLPMHCLKTERDSLMTFRSQDGSIEVDLEVRLSSRRRVVPSPNDENAVSSETDQRAKSWLQDVLVEPLFKSREVHCELPEVHCEPPGCEPVYDGDIYY